MDLGELLEFWDVLVEELVMMLNMVDAEDVIVDDYVDDYDDDWDDDDVVDVDDDAVVAVVDDDDDVLVEE